MFAEEGKGEQVLTHFRVGGRYVREGKPYKIKKESQEIMMIWRFIVIIIKIIHQINAEPSFFNSFYIYLRQHAMHLLWPCPWGLSQFEKFSLGFLVTAVYYLFPTLKYLAFEVLILKLVFVYISSFVYIFWETTVNFCLRFDFDFENVVLSPFSHVPWYTSSSFL